MKAMITTVALLLAFHMVFSQFSRLPSASETFIDNEMDDILDLGATGTAVAVVVNGRVVYLKGYGFADSANGLEVNEQTLFRTASICKPLTEILAVMVDNDNTNFSVNDLVLDWYPYWSWAQNNPTITVQDLMDHSSGLPNYGGAWDASMAANYADNFPIYDAQAALDIVDQVIPVDSTYSTFNYMILGAVLEKVSGVTYQELIKTYYTDPLNMHKLQPEYEWVTYTNKAKGYEADGDESDMEDNSGGTNITYKVPAGGFLATAADWALFIKAYTDNSIPDDNSDTFLIHRGIQAGAYNRFRMSKDTDDGVVIFTNTELGNTSRDAVDTAVIDIYNHIGGLANGDLTGPAFDETQTTFSSIQMQGTIPNGEDPVYVATNISTGSFTAEPGSDVRCLADEEIRLQPGFTAETGSYFVASIENVAGGFANQGAGSRAREAQENVAALEQPTEVTQTSPIQQLTATGEIYPNPTKGRVSVNLKDLDGDVTLEVYDLLGNLIYTDYDRANGHLKKVLDLSAYRRGVYILRIEKDGELLMTRKILKK